MFEAVKKAATELALDRAVQYVSQDPERNIFVMLDFAARIATRPEHKESIRLLREHFRSRPLILEQAKRLAKNPKMLSKFMINWVANNILIGKMCGRICP